MEDFNSITDHAKAWWTIERTEKILGKKRLVLNPVAAAPLLRTLALMNKDGSISPDKLKKYLQLNHMLQILETKLIWVAKQNKTVRILDACCGTSFLGLSLAWYFKHIMPHPVEILGIDRNEAVVNTSNERAKWLQLDAIARFLPASISLSSWDDQYRQAYATDENVKLNILVALHACDIASDVAIALAIAAKVNLLAIAPCCQAELNQALQVTPLSDSHPLRGAMEQPQLRRELAAHLTDSLRCLAISAKGYEVTATEFIESTHTPKNRLILAERRGNYWLPARESFIDLWHHLGTPGFTLFQLLQSADLWDHRETFDFKRST